MKDIVSFYIIIFWLVLDYVSVMMLVNQTLYKIIKEHLWVIEEKQKNKNSKLYNNNNCKNLNSYYSLNKTYKRCMFTKVGNIKNLKKSGDLLTMTEKDSIIKPIESTTFLSNLTSLDLANNMTKQQYIIEQTSSSVTTVAIKDIGTGSIFPMQINRHLATYGRINRRYPINDNLFNTTSFIKYKGKCIAAAEEALKKDLIKKDQFLVYLKRINALDLSYAHATLIDIAEEQILKEGDEYVTIIYHVITTKPIVVDYGGPNQYTPIFLYQNKETNTTYYTIPLTYVQTLKKDDYLNYFILKNKQVFKDHTSDVQNNLACSLKKVSEINTFKMLNINQKCLNLNFSEIIPTEEFPDSIYSNNITDMVPQVPVIFN